MAESKKTVLFVCLGNICRSPIAEAVFNDTLKQQGQTDLWTVDSAAIGKWHDGRSPDPRALQIMKKYNLPYDNVAQQIKKQHFKKFDYIIGMDMGNLADLKKLAPKDSTAKLLILGEFDTTEFPELNMYDPYYDTHMDNFEECYLQCVRCCPVFLQQVNEKKI